MVRSLSTTLLASAAGAALLASGPALAQTAGANNAQNAAPGSAQPSAALEEVVVTATRQTNTVNRVALSIAAVTQRTLDEQGIKQAQDITRLVPGLTLNIGEARGASSTSGNFSIRGVVAQVGAATTGIYLDDTSLTKRSNTGTAQLNGAPLPVLFDLDRVEVLKGPQGTLYGGSSQGGAVRFITPAPSVSRYSGQARLEVNSVEDGGLGYEIGAAVGGPIVMDKLGFRFSALQRRTAGFIDAYDAYTGALLKKDGNGRNDFVLNPQLLWQIDDRASVRASVYWGRGRSDGGPGSVTSIYLPNGQLAPATQTFTVPTVCNPTTRPANLGFGVAWTVPTVACSTPGAFQRPGRTYGPWRTGKDVNLVTTGQGRMNAGVTNDLRVGALTLNYRFDWFTATSITSLVNEVTDLDNTASFEDPNSRNTTLEDPAHMGFPLFWYAKPNGLVGDYDGGFISKNKRQQFSQEVRLTSPADQRPISWVAGVYYADSNTNIGYRYPGDGTPQLLAYYGIDDIAKYGIDNIDGLMARLDAKMIDRELAGYADVNYWLTSRLKIEAGVRYASIYFNYDQLNYGQFSGRLPSNPLSLTRGTAKATPVAPKFGLEYQFTPDRIVYFTAAKGFRAGGVNPAVSQSVCDAALTALGITAEQIPPAYNPDEVWSYEVGEKFRLLDNRLQLNTALYRIDWSNVQATVPIACGFNFVMNGGRARSEGFDLQSQFRPFNPLTLTLNASYTNARYLDPVAGPNPRVQVAPSINAGDGFSIPKWQASASAQYDTALWGPYTGYARLDYQWQDAYLNGPSYGTASFNPFTYHAQAQSLVNVRLGVRREGFEINIFSNNVTGARAQIGNAGNGKTVCNATTGGPNCTVFSTYSPFVSANYQRPRTVGVQMNYRF